MFSSPVTISNRIPPTSISSDTRSSACASDRDRRPREQPRDHRPQLRQHDRDQDQPEPDVQTLVEPVEPRRGGRPVERRQVQPADVARDRLAELRPVRDVGEQAGDGHDGQRDEQDDAEHRRQPRPAQRAAPTRRALQPRRWVLVQTTPQPRGEPVSAGVGRRRIGVVTVGHVSRVARHVAMVCAQAASVTNSSGSGGSAGARRRH